MFTFYMPSFTWAHVQFIGEGGWAETKLALETTPLCHNEYLIYVAM